MSARIRAVVPLLNVGDVERSAAFYRLLGFEMRQSFTPDGSDKAHWASLVSGETELMIGTAAGKAGPPSGFALYVYANDLRELHSDLEAGGTEVGEIRTPFFNPGGEFSLRDPDGHLIHVA